MHKEILKAQIEALEEQKQTISRAIVDKHEELTELEREPEKSTAEKWYSNRYSGSPTSWSHDYTTVIKAHEAGQAQATAATHEIYRPLVKLCEYMTRHCGYIFTQAASSGTFQKLEKALKNLNQPAQEAEPEIIGHVSSISHSSSYEGNISKITMVVPGHTRDLKYKLTPID